MPAQPLRAFGLGRPPSPASGRVRPRRAGCRSGRSRSAGLTYRWLARRRFGLLQPGGHRFGLLGPGHLDVLDHHLGRAQDAEVDSGAPPRSAPAPAPRPAGPSSARPRARASARPASCARARRRRAAPDRPRPCAGPPAIWASHSIASTTAMLAGRAAGSFSSICSTTAASCSGISCSATAARSSGGGASSTCMVRVAEVARGRGRGPCRSSVS